MFSKTTEPIVMIFFFEELNAEKIVTDEKFEKSYRAREI